ncbi:hypothetical protein BDA99DRAFT_22532 [Phascolomyces articulosus]|uniref:DUF6532 domain-containing protein n=1 Tax=Phascolomyces articulosus TaxID=60185 RepID=A0AAD5PFD4_9FUNG|nr:hypothetical protein BDA99DRAFT_22532 [Phascolomyces articulosus]
MLTFDPEDIYTWEKFETDVGMYIYTVNVFPDTAESNEAADNLAIKYTSAIIDFEKYDYEADKVIQSEFRRLMPLKRTSAHEQVKTKATKYQFPRDLLPTGFRTHRSKKQLFYLIDRLRFARERYSDNGTLLQSQFISDILFQVFFNERGRGGPRVSPTPNLIPLALICITFTMIYFHLCKSCNHPQATEKNTMFTANSYWRDVYDNYLHRRTSETRNIDWDRISEYHTNVIRGLQGRTHNEALDTTNAAETELRLYDGISDNDMID